MTEQKTDAPAGPARLAEVVLSVARRLNHLDHEDTRSVPLTPVEVLVIRHIDANPGVTPSQIAARLGLKSSNTSAALRDLEAKGFIQRRVDAADGRSVRVESTPAAQQNLASKREHWVRVLAPYLTDADAIAAVIAALTELDEALEGRTSAAAQA